MIFSTLQAVLQTVLNVPHLKDYRTYLLFFSTAAACLARLLKQPSSTS